MKTVVIFTYLVLSSFVYAGPIPSSAIFCKPQKGQPLSIIEDNVRGFFVYPPHLGNFAAEKEANILYRKNFEQLKIIIREACNDSNFKDAPAFVSKIHRECNKLCEKNAVKGVHLCNTKCNLSWSSAMSYVDGYANAMANEEKCEPKYSPAKPSPGAVQ